MCGRYRQPQQGGRSLHELRGDLVGVSRHLRAALQQVVATRADAEGNGALRVGHLLDAHGERRRGVSARWHVQLERLELIPQRIGFVAAGQAQLQTGVGAVQHAHRVAGLLQADGLRALQPQLIIAR